jgi:hypothetical protein
MATGRRRIVDMSDAVARPTRPPDPASPPDQIETVLTDCVLRPLLKADFPLVVALWQRSRDADLGAAEQALLARLAAERTVMVADVAGAVAGFVVVDLAAGTAEAPVTAVEAGPGVAERLAAMAAALIDHGGRAAPIDVAA